MKKWTGMIILSTLFLGAIAYLFKGSILMSIGDFLIIEDDLKPVDVIHVIAGEDYRAEYAIQLYKQGYAKQIFFTGGLCQVHGNYHGLHGQQLALLQGVPPEAIALDDSSVTSTYDEVTKLKAWMDQSPIPIHSVIVVSDSFHMRRARWTYRQVLGEGVEIVMAPVPFDQTPFNRRWWLDDDSRNFVRDEYIKSIYYVLRYQLAWGKFKEWLAAFDIN